LSRFANHYFFDLCALAMFIPLLTSRAQRFHPWYLSWALVFWPLCRHPRTHTAMLILSVSAMLRYLPYLWFHEYTDAITLSQQVITLLPVTVYAVAIMVTHFVSPAAKKGKLNLPNNWIIPVYQDNFTKHLPKSPAPMVTHFVPPWLISWHNLCQEEIFYTYSDLPNNWILPVYRKYFT